MTDDWMPAMGPSYTDVPLGYRDVQLDECWRTTGWIDGVPLHLCRAHPGDNLLGLCDKHYRKLKGET